MCVKNFVQAKLSGNPERNTFFYYSIKGNKNLNYTPS